MAGRLSLNKIECNKTLDDDHFGDIPKQTF